MPKKGLTPYYTSEQESAVFYHGDCLHVMRRLPTESVDAVVTDPPYGLEFMGKEWDRGVPGVIYWQETLRLLKPGGHLLTFGGTRTYHRMACAVEDAGFEIRDCIVWMYGSGFPKSLDVSKAIDKVAGVEREVGPVDLVRHASLKNQANAYVTKAGWRAGNRKVTIDPPATEEAKEWDGWGTALKPAMEPIVVARKPLVGTVAENVQRYGTGALNVDSCRVGEDGGTSSVGAPNLRNKVYGRGMGGLTMIDAGKGRWPANVVHDGSNEVLGLLPETDGSASRVGRRTGKGAGRYGALTGQNDVKMGHDDEGGSVARFFYCAKPSEFERGNANVHPTVKPVELMRWLCRLVTSKGGLILDPFLGSGTTAIAACREGFRIIGIEKEAEYLEMCRSRMKLEDRPPLF